MLAALRNIEASMAGVSTQILRSGGINTGSNLGIATGTLSVNQGDPILNRMGSDLKLGLSKELNFLGNIGIVKSLQGLWGKTKQEIIDAGLSIQGSVAALSEGRGVRQYADVKTTKSSWGGLRKDSSNSTTYGAVDDSVARQFGLIFANVGNILQTSALQLGRDGQAVADAVAGFTVDISRLSLKDLKGDELQEAIAVAIGAQADNIAATVLPGLLEFQRVGEGYFETLVRVAGDVETAAYELEHLGVAAIAFGDVVRKQGDVAGEIVRQSISAAESVAGSMSSVGQIISTLDGTAAELASAYRQLVDVRHLLQGVGVDGNALSTGMIRGAGGLDGLGRSLETYLEGFFSEEERTAAGMARLRSEFDKLGISDMPATRDAFRSLVESIDPATEAGGNLFARVVALSDSFAELVPATSAAARTLAEIAQERLGLENRLLQLQGNTTELRRRELELLDPSNRGLQQEIWKLEDAQAAASAWRDVGGAASSAASAAANAWQSVWSGIGDEVKRLRGSVLGGSAIGFAALQGQFATATASARAGNAEAGKLLPGLSKQIDDAALKSAGTREEYQMVQARLATSLERTLTTTGAPAEILQGIRADAQARHQEDIAAQARNISVMTKVAKILEKFDADGMPKERE